MSMSLEEAEAELARRQLQESGPFSSAERKAASMAHAQSHFREGGGQFVHGLAPSQVEALYEPLRKRLEAFVPGTSMNSLQATWGNLLPPGAAFVPGAGKNYQASKRAVASAKKTSAMTREGNSAMMPSSGSMYSMPSPFLPEFACVLEGTSVPLYNGTFKPIEEVEVGDAVIGSNGEPTRVERHWCSGVPEELVHIELWGGQSFTTTTTHKWPAWIWQRTCLCGCGSEVTAGRCFAAHHSKRGRDKGKTVEVSPGNENTLRLPAGYEPVQKVEARALRRDDMLLIPRKFEELATDVTPGRARLLGYYAAEGNVQNERQIKFSLNSNEDETLGDDLGHLLKAEGHVARYWYSKEQNAMTVTSEGDPKFTAWFVEHCGQYSDKKVLSEVVMRWPLELKREFLRGYIQGDGTHRWKDCKHGGSGGFEVSFTTTSKVMGQQVWLMLAQLGYAGRMYWKEPHTYNDGVTRKGKWDCEVGGEPARKLADLVWGKRSKSRDRQAIDKYPGLMMDDDYVYVPIKSVKTIPNVTKARVWNMTVSAEDHNYLIGAGVAVLTSNSPDRLAYPVHRTLANNYWRLYYKLDPDIGTGIDILSELPWGDFELNGEGVDGEVKERMDLCVETSKIKTALPYMQREFLVLGEAGVHCTWNSDQGIWTHVGFLNPDMLEVIGIPMIKHDPIVRYQPDSRLRSVLMSDHEQARQLRESMPDEMFDVIMSGRPVDLAPTNFTFLARKLHPYDVRGTSIISRAWRTLMLEDAVWNADIQISRRMAAPVKVAKLGDPNTGHIPSPELATKFETMLAQVEQDPAAWLTWTYALQFELVGVQERSIKATQYSQMLQSNKLVALGINKAILNSETAYAAAVTGLTVFLQRLKAMREYFESEWIIPKFFRQMSEMNAWIKPTPAELSHGVRTKRSAYDLANDPSRYIIPKLEWARKLDPSVEQAQITAIQSLQSMGCKFSQQTLMSYVNRSYEEELKSIAAEQITLQKMVQQYPGLAQALMPPTADGGAPGSGGGGAPGGMLPPIPPEAMGFDAPPPDGAPPSPDAPPSDAPAPGPAPEGASAQAAADDRGQDTTKMPDAGQAPQNQAATAGGWTQEQLMAIASLANGSLVSAFEIAPFSGYLATEGGKIAVKSGDPFVIARSLDSYLISLGYSQQATQEAIVRFMRSAPGQAKASQVDAVENTEVSKRLAEIMDDLDRDTRGFDVYTGAL